MSEKFVSQFEHYPSQAEGGNKKQKLVLVNAKKNITDPDSWSGEFINSGYLFKPTEY